MKSKYLLVLLVVLLAQVLALPALASCLLPESCLCMYSGRLVVQAKVVDNTAGHGVVQVEAIDNPDGEATNLAVGATATAALDSYGFHVAAFKLGDRFLGRADGSGGVRAITAIDQDGHVTCAYAPSFRPTVAQARAMMSSSNCPAAMTAAGFVAPPCNDTGGVNNACSATPSSRGNWAWLGLFLGACGVAGWRRRAASARST